MRARISKAVAALAALAALALLAGCGGGSSSDDFVADANKICKDVNTKIRAIPKPQTPSEFKGYIDKTQPITEDGVNQISDLTPPDDKKDQFDAWVSTLHQSEDVVNSAKEKVDSGNVAAAVAQAARAKPLNTKGNAQARALGLPECAKDNSGSSGSSGSS